MRKIPPGLYQRCTVTGYAFKEGGKINKILPKIPESREFQTRSVSWAYEKPACVFGWRWKKDYHRWQAYIRTQEDEYYWSFPKENKGDY